MINLPYPDLDFVPLDILTAPELNQIVANYTYIANQFPIGGNNIDFESFIEMPSATVTAMPFGYGSTVDLIRVGNIVFLTGLPQYTSEPATGWVALGETIPDGFKPINARNIIGVTGNVSVFYTINPDGTMSLQKQGDLNGRWLTFSASWPTADEWPTE